MGFLIRSNIFNAGYPSQKYFVLFPIQVAILFKPSDTSFAGYLGKIHAKGNVVGRGRGAPGRRRDNVRIVNQLSQLKNQRITIG